MRMHAKDEPIEVNSSKDNIIEKRFHGIEKIMASRDGTLFTLAIYGTPAADSAEPGSLYFRAGRVRVGPPTVTSAWTERFWPYP
jgi:hypothetical protein